MKKLTAFALLAGASLLAASCSKGGQEEPPTPPTPSGDEKIEIKINPTVGDSRATDYGFETGDCIGLYVVNYTGTTPGKLVATGNHVDNMRFRYDGTWTPDSPIYWKDDATHADFYIYYPYAAVTTVDAYAFSVRADQSTEAAYKASDLLVGRALDVAPTEAAVQLPASHVMSRAMIYLEAGNGFTKESLAAAKVDVKINGVKCGSTVNLATGVATATGDAVSVAPLRDGDVYKAIIVPQSVAEGRLISVTVDGREFVLRKAFTFAAAQSHKFTVVLSKTSNGVNVGINPWGDDGTDNGGTAE